MDMTFKVYSPDWIIHGHTGHCVTICVPHSLFIKQRCWFAEVSWELMPCSVCLASHSWKAGLGCPPASLGWSRGNHTCSLCSIKRMQPDLDLLLNMYIIVCWWPLMNCRQRGQKCSWERKRKDFWRRHWPDSVMSFLVRSVTVRCH
jgi:hypothetical protein